MSKSHKPALPKVDLETFAAIVEGRRSCRTLKELESLARYELQGGAAPPDAARIQEHLRKCPDCEGHYDALQVLVRAEARAIRTALEGQSQ